MSAISAAGDRLTPHLERLFADRDDVVRASAIAGLGLASTLIYLLLTVRMSLYEFFPGPGITVDFVKMLGPDWQGNSALLLTSFAGLFIFFGIALASLGEGRGPLTLTALFGMPVVFVIVLTFMYPPMAVDFIHNVADARTLYLFGDNPMIAPPNAHDFPIGQSYGDESAPYGPLWFLLLFPVVLAGEGLQAALHILKFYTSLYYLGSALLIFLIARRVTPGRELFAFTLYAWNPFVVWRAAGNGHNDVVMFFFVVLAVWLMVEGRWRFVLPALTCAVLIKYVPVILVPPVLLGGFFIAANPRAYMKDMAIGAGLSVILTLAVFSILWEGSQTFDTVRNQGEKFITSTPVVLRDELVFTFDVAMERATSVTRWVTNLAFVAVFLGLVLAYWRSRRGFTDLISCLALISFAFPVIAVSWYRPWYMLWALALLPLVPGRWPVAMIVAISVGGMTFDLIEQYRLRFEFFREHYLWSLALPVIVAFLPAVLIWLYGWTTSRRPLLV